MVATAAVGGVHPAKLHRGMLAAAQNAGAIVHGETAVYGFAPRHTGFAVETTRGRVETDYVLLGTNGYTDHADPPAAEWGCRVGRQRGPAKGGIAKRGGNEPRGHDPEANGRYGGGCPASTAQLLCRAMCRSLSKLIVARIIGPVA